MNVDLTYAPTVHLTSRSILFVRFVTHSSPPNTVKTLEVRSEEGPVIVRDVRTQNRQTLSPCPEEDSSPRTGVVRISFVNVNVK